MTTDGSSPRPGLTSTGEEPGPVRRVLAAVAWGVAGALVASTLDAHVAFSAAASPPSSRIGLLLADAGVLVPVGLIVGAVVGTLAELLGPGGARAVLLWIRGSSTEDAGSSRRASATTLVVGLLAVPGLVLLSQIAKRAFAAEVPSRSSGAGAGLAAVLIAAMGALASDGLGRFTAASPAALPSRPVALVVATTLVVAGVAWGVATGTPNGDGSAFGILGVLAREELDLRGVGLLGLVAATAWVGPSVLRLATAAALLAGLVPLSLTLLCARSLDDRATSLAIERGAPVGARALAVLRRATDRDRDGASRFFGGGDCDDASPNVGPFSDDVPGNGIDEDCSGADLETATTRAPPASTPAAARATGAPPPAPFERPRNVILITVDTLRADLGFSGNPRPVSPSLDALAARAVVFERAYSLASYTGKSLGPMLLGKYPSETRRSYAHFDKFGTDEAFVQERLQKAGVRTLTAQGHWYFRPDTGLGRGFDDADHSAAPKVPQMEGDRTVNGDRLTDAAISLLSKPANVAAPFYLWVHYLDPHAEYVKHPEWEFGKKGRDLYDGEVAFVDREIGRLLDHVARSPFGEKTAIVVTSDHGEAFGEHGMYRHGFEVWEERVRVPLVVYVPGVAPRRIAEKRSAIDVVPTLLELLGLPLPPRDGADFVSGRSLVPDLSSAPGATLESRDVLVDMCDGPFNDERQAFVTGNMKVLATRGRPLGLYDLAVDPGEKQDLLGDPARAEPVVAAFKAFRRGLRVVAAKR